MGHSATGENIIGLCPNKSVFPKLLQPDPHHSAPLFQNDLEGAISSRFRSRFTMSVIFESQTITEVLQLDFQSKPLKDLQPLPLLNRMLTLKIQLQARKPAGDTWRPP